MTGHAVVRAGFEHAAVFAALHELCFAPLPETPWSETAFRTVLKMPGALAFAAEGADSAPIGLLVAREAGDVREILTVCVTPGARRGGVAKALFAAYFGEVPPETRTVLEVAVDNDAAVALYMDLGFRPVGRRPDYYSGDGARTDALILAHKTAQS